MHDSFAKWQFHAKNMYVIPFWRMDVGYVLSDMQTHIHPYERATLTFQLRNQPERSSYTDVFSLRTHTHTKRFWCECAGDLIKTVASHCMCLTFRVQKCYPFPSSTHVWANKDISHD